MTFWREINISEKCKRRLSSGDIITIYLTLATGKPDYLGCLCFIIVDKYAETSPFEVCLFNILDGEWVIVE